MSDLISRKDLLQEIEPMLTWELLDKINKMPAVDAEPVVRCRDCKHWGEEEFAEGGYRECNCQQKEYATTDPKNHAYFQLWLENDFCSYGERKGGDRADLK